GEGHHGVDDLGDAPGLRAADLSTAGIQIADDVAYIFFGGHDFNPHDRLENARGRLLHRLAEAGPAGDLEGQHRGVDIVVGAVEERELHVHDRKADHGARIHHRFDAL